LKPDKRKRLEQQGFHVGSVEEWLKLTPEEREEIERRLQALRDQQPPPQEKN
jgi:hypothetical protein